MQKSTRPWFIRHASALLIAGFGLAILAGAATVAVVLRSGDAEAWVQHTLQVREVAQNLLINIQDVESGQRGFILTTDAEYLERYDAVQKQVPEIFARLRSLTADNPAEQHHLDALKPLIDEKFDLIAKTVALMRSGQRDQAIALVQSDRGRQVMDGIRTEITAMLQTERELLPQREATAEALRFWLLVFIAICLASALALAAALARSTQYYIVRLRERTLQLEAEAGLRLRTEETLRQSQKLEAVGQLTGGIAHDFNNLLTIIIGNLDTLRRRLVARTDGGSGELTAPLDMAIKGARSAAQLTHRLLAFARRQPLEPARLDLNRLVSSMSDLLSRTLGESINVETVLAGGLWPTFADANQLENALLNLAINARDAMPKGGRLTIETANSFLDDAYAARFGDLSPGQYVMLSVTDTGTGIAPDLMEKIFEPFFTTKGEGEGSGLGLAMVHGFVKQSGGHVRIYSELGQGTSVKIYLPRLMEAEQGVSAPAERKGIAPAIAGSRPDETILVVEDNEGVREYAKSALEEMGYNVLQASDAVAALHILESRGRIDLLFTDVVLPGGMNGRDLAARALERRPELPVLFTTGYTRNAIVHHGRLDANVNLLGKPYTQQDLARKLRELLDARPGSSPVPPSAVRPGRDGR